MDSAKKTAVFEEIFADEEDEEEEEEPDADDELDFKLTKQSIESVRPATSIIQKNDQFTRDNGGKGYLQPLPSATSTSSKTNPVVKDMAPLGRRQAAGPPDKADPKGSKGRASKRRRLTSPDPKVKIKRLFEGLVFFFVPSGEADRVQAFKIKIAREFGAEWAREWQQGITHILAAERITHEDLLTWLAKQGVKPIPPEIAIVNESYVPWCIELGKVADPRQPHYYIKGYKEPSHASTPEKSSLESSERRRLDRSLLNTNDETSKEDPGKDALNPLNRRSPEQNPSSGSQAVRQFDDDLSRAIEEAQSTKDLPLDLDEDTKAPTPDDGSDDESQEQPRPKSRGKSFLSTSGQQGFSCMSKHDGTSKDDNPNSRVMEVLQEMATYYDRIGDHWRSTSYRKAITTLKKQDQRILTKEQALLLPNIGARLAEKIEEIATTNRLRRLESTKNDPTDAALQLFMGIYGVGFSLAQKWVDAGHRNLPDLSSNVSLSKNQQVGIDHYDDFNSRIPRNEMQQHDAFVRGFAAKVDKDLCLTIGGSYRRGAVTSGDIDFIVTKPNASASLIKSIMLDRLIPSLLRIGYLKIALAAGSMENREGGSKWHGACALLNPSAHEQQSVSSPWRRIDFLFVPWDERGAAFIYFTGNDIFNRSIRLLARKKGMRLNQHGLYKDVLRGPQAKRLTQGTLVESADEKKIFEALGVPWREPWERIC